MKPILFALSALLLTAGASFATSEPGSHPWLDKQLKKQRFRCPAGDSPFRGAADAPVTITEFADYDCSYCHDQEAALKKVLETYPTQVKLVFKNLPLPMHPNAKRKALVAECMGAQGKFWQAHDRFMAGDPPKKARAGVDQGKLDAMIAQGGNGQVDKDIALAKRLGLATTPSFVIDGIRQGGTIGYPQFKLLVDAEVARKAAKAANAEKAEADKADTAADTEDGNVQGSK